MPALAMAQPGLRLTFNLVPALVEQLESYADGSATDRHLEITRKPAADLSESEACFLLQEFFMANWENMIRPSPRYWELLHKRGTFFHPSELPAILRRFHRQDLLDLQVWFNLAWTDPLYLKNDPVLAEICAKARDFTEEDKSAMLQRQAVILQSIVPAYRQAVEKGAAELCTSPFYHPILPLLCDSDVARQCMPGADLPSRFAHPQDAELQVAKALDFMEQRFGARPRGMWPSEGSVSQQAVDIIYGLGVEWIATDEGILERSLERPLRANLEPSDPETLYRPYRMSPGSPAIFFRDRILSDLIGFTYASWKPQEAAADLVSRLERIASSLGSKAGQHLVPVILDGENAWEAYQDDGNEFLKTFYHGLIASNNIKTCTFSEFLDSNSRCGRLERLHPGSWINSDFGIWIGQREDHAAWELLRQVRQCLMQRSQALEQEVRQEAEQEILIAEGSDWCWWYGGDFDSEHLAEFDRLYRAHIAKAYRLMGLEVPEEVLTPIVTAKPAEKMISRPIDLISPVIDGRTTDFYEWAGSGKLDTAVQGGTMHRSQSLIKALYYGCDHHRLYIRLDPAAGIKQEEYPELNVAIDFFKPENRKITLDIFDQPGTGTDLEWAYDRIIEMAIPFDHLGAKEGDKIQFQIYVRTDSIELEKHPNLEMIVLTVPSRITDIENWQV
jgi:alpha-amylase/alpha-mannosidase (GH57 family)